MRNAALARLLCGVVLTAAAVARSTDGPASPPASRPMPALASLASRATGEATAASEPDAARPDRATLARLRTFKARNGRSGVATESFLRDLEALSPLIPDDQLAAVAGYAAGEGKPVQWGLAHLLVDRGRVDAAAGVIVGALLDDPNDREYRLWKWWSYAFSARPDYDRLNEAIGEALVAEFAKGSPERRRVVADVFGKGAAAVDLSAEAFRRSVLGPVPASGPAKREGP